MTAVVKRLPKHGGLEVRFHHRDTMRMRHTHPRAMLPTHLAAVAATTLPVDCTGNGSVAAPVDANDSVGDCMLAMACHVDGFWTYGRGETGFTESMFDVPAIVSQYEAASGGDNGLDEPTLLTKCWQPGLAGQKAATYDDSLSIVVTDIPLTQYCIDQFFHVAMMWSVPDAFLQNFQPGGRWPSAAVPDPNNGHGTPLADVGTDGFYRLYTWGSWVWSGPDFIASVDPECFVVFSRRQFNAAGYDAHGRHVSAVAAAWVGLGGNAAKANAVVAMFPAAGPTPPPPVPVPTPTPDPVPSPPSPVAATLEGAIAAMTAGFRAGMGILDQDQAIASGTKSLTDYWPRPGR